MPNWIEEHDGFDIYWNVPPDQHYPWPAAPIRAFRCVETLGLGFRCYSKDCQKHNYRVRRKWESRALKSLPQSQAKVWAVTLPIGMYLPQAKLAGVRQGFNRRMRRKGFMFEYYWVLHRDHGLLNLHLLVKTLEDITVEGIEQAWRNGMWFVAGRRDLKNTFYCEPCYAPVGYIGYSTQTATTAQTSMNRVPPRGWYRNLFGITRGFERL
jgi:hypothetical protein